MTQVADSTVEDTSTPKELTVDCPAGTNVTGGGYVFGGPVGGTGSVTALRSYPLDADTWLVRAAAVPGFTPSWHLTVDAVCAG